MRGSTGTRRATGLLDLSERQVNERRETQRRQRKVSGAWLWWACIVCVLTLWSRASSVAATADTSSDHVAVHGTRTAKLKAHKHSLRHTPCKLFGQNRPMESLRKAFGPGNWRGIVRTARPAPTCPHPRSYTHGHPRDHHPPCSHKQSLRSEPEPEPEPETMMEPGCIPMVGSIGRRFIELCSAIVVRKRQN